jgi:TRAP transporter TAXI family solute receptor
MSTTRRNLIAGLSTAMLLPRPGIGQAAVLTFATAGRGSAFLPYGTAIGTVIEAAGAARIEIRETGGSNDNLKAIQEQPQTIGTVFLGSAFAAMNGTGFAAGVKHDGIRALFPMYETSFQIAALARSGITTARQLDGKKVGCGPARGPAEDFFKVLAEAIGIRPTIVPGAPADLAKALAEGQIDALWQGAVVPIPSLVQASQLADTLVFGLSGAEVAEMCRRLPFMAEAVVAGGTYKGQPDPIRSVAAWNFVLANKALPDDLAYAVTRAVMTAPGLVQSVGPAAAGTRPQNAGTNAVVPFHPGALRFYQEAGIALR